MLRHYNQTNMQSTFFRRPVFTWALYDWANSAFATTVMVVFFPLFFKQHLTVDQSAATSTFWLGVANGTSSFVLAVMAPWLGAMADKGNAHIRMLAWFTAIGVIPTALLAFVGSGDWITASFLFAVASIGFWGGIIFYDSLVVRVAPPGKLDSVSGFGYSLGYLGGGLLLLVNVLMYGKPELFGIESKEAAIRWSFVMVAVWWAVFALPLLRSKSLSSNAPVLGTRQAAREGFAELKRTFHEVRKHKPVILFLLAYWMYIDGVNTVMKMAVDYGLALGFPADSLIVGILMIQFIGFPATLLFGWLGDRISPLLGIFVAIAIYLCVTVYAVFMQQVSEFYVLAVAIGCVQGAVQSMSRSYYGRLIPQDRAGEFYGFYNMMGKFAAVLGPFLMGFTALLAGSSRYSILSLSVLFIGGSLVLWAAARARIGAS
jgi:UMF1 family MFS transporter